MQSGSCGVLESAFGVGSIGHGTSNYLIEGGQVQPVQVQPVQGSNAGLPHHSSHAMIYIKSLIGILRKITRGHTDTYQKEIKKKKERASFIVQPSDNHITLLLMRMFQLPAFVLHWRNRNANGVFLSAGWYNDLKLHERKLP